MKLMRETKLVKDDIRSEENTGRREERLAEIISMQLKIDAMPDSEKFAYKQFKESAKEEIKEHDE